MITPEQRTALIKLRLQQAHKSARSAEALVQINDFGGALNRIYYAMFYAVLALALNENFETSKHGYLLGWFNKTYVKPAIFPPIMFKMLRDAYDRRIEADYELGPLPKSEDIPGIMEEMKGFIAQIESFLTKP